MRSIFKYDEDIDSERKAYRHVHGRETKTRALSETGVEAADGASQLASERAGGPVAGMGRALARREGVGPLRLARWGRGGDAVGAAGARRRPRTRCGASAFRASGESPAPRCGGPLSDRQGRIIYYNMIYNTT